MSDSAYQFTLLADESEELREWGPRPERALRGVPQVADVNSDQEVRGLQMTLSFDRETAARLGLSPRQIDSALNLAFGQAVVSTIYGELNQYRVVMEVAPEHWQGPEALDARLWRHEAGSTPLATPEARSVKGYKETLLSLPEDAWDIYFLYGPEARWEADLPPTPRFWMHQLGSRDSPRVDGPYLRAEAFADSVKAALKRP